MQRRKQKKNYRRPYEHWKIDAYLLPEEDYVTDVEYLQLMSKLAGISMCAAESGTLNGDDDGFDVGDDIDVDPLEYV